MKSPTTARLAVLLLSALAAASGTGVQAQTSFTGNSSVSTGLWNTSRWNNSADAAPFASTYTANNSVSFTSGNYTFTGMGATTNVGNVTVAAGVSVTFSSTNSTYATGGLVRTIDVASNGLFDLNANSVSTAAGTGFIKSGAGVFGTGAGTFTGGFTLNAGTVIARGTTGLGSGATNILTLNGGTVASNASRTFDNTRFGGGIVIGGNVQFGELAANVSLASNTASLSFANNVSLGAATRTFTIGNNGTNTFSGNISAAAGVGLTIDANSGTTGSIILSGTANSYTGNTTISAGTLTMATNLIQSSTNIVIGNGASLNATSGFIMTSGQSITGTGATGFVGGQLNPGLTMSGNNTISNNAGGILTLNRLSVSGTNNTITAGDIRAGGSGTGQRGLGLGNNSTATLTISGGSLTTNGSAANGDFVGATGNVGTRTLIISGGNYTANSASGLNIGSGAGAGTLTISSGTVTLPLLTLAAVNGFSSAIVNLDGGRLNLGGLTVSSGLANQFNFNGGQFVATGNVTMANGGNATNYNVKDGGANIDTGVNNVIITGNLIRFAGNSTGGLTKTGSGTLLLSSANNTYSGGTTISAGTLVFGANSVASGTGTVSSSPIGTGNLTLGDGTTLAASGGRSLYVPRINVGGNITIAQASVNVGRVSLAGTIDLGNGVRTLTLGRASTDYASGQEVLRFEGNATFGTTTTIQNGSLIVSTLTGNATNPSIIRTGSGATANFANNLALTLDDGVAYSTGTASLFGTGTNAPALTLNAAVTRGGGVLQMGDGISSGNATMRNAEVYSLAGGGIVSSSNTSGNITSGSTGTLTINNGNGANFSGTITEAGGVGRINVTKTGLGTQTLSGDNSYTGTTTVNGGALFLNGASNGTGSYTVNATLGGSGTITTATASTFTVNGGGSIAPGASAGAIGDLTFDGANRAGTVATFASGATFTFDINSTSETSDTIVLSNGETGDFVFNSNVINITVVGSLLEGQVYTLFSATAGDNFSGLTVDGGTGRITAGLSFTGLGGAFQTNSFLELSGGDIILGITAIPEPHEYAIAIGALLLLVVLKRRRRVA